MKPQEVFVISLCHLTPKECPSIEIDNKRPTKEVVRIFDDETGEEIHMSREHLRTLVRKAKGGELDF